MKMTKVKFSLIAIVAMAAVSCAKEITPEVENTINPNLVEITLTATGEYDEETKAAFSGYPRIAWQAGDEISLLGTKTGNQKLTTNAAGHQTTFTGYADVTDDVYYAVYPYDSNVTLNADGSLSGVTVPAIQKATANNFDPDAYIAVAKSTDKESLYFMAVGGFVKFNLEDAENVKSVTMVMNGDSKNMASTASKTTITETGVTHGGSYTNVSDRVKLEGDFESGKAYFMVVRPQPYSAGVTLYIEYKDGTIRSRKGTSALFESGKGRNYIRNLGTLRKANFPVVNDLYSLYEMGYDVKVGDIVLNKANNGTATKVTATEANTTVYNQFNNGGIYFMETAEGGSFQLHSNVAVTDDVYIIGNDPSRKVVIDMNGKNVNHTAKTVALKNLELDTDACTNYVFANNNATADADAFILDNCSVTGLVKPLWYVNVAGYTLKNLTLVNTDIALAAGTNIIDLGKTTSLGNENVTIKNCVLYGASNYVSRIVNNSQNLTSWTADVVFENNTVYNLHAGTSNGLLHMAGANSVVFRNNLVSFYSLNATEYVIRIWKNTPTYTVENNHFWSRHYKDGVQQLPEDVTLYGNTKITWAAANITSGAYPFTSTVPGAGATR